MLSAVLAASVLAGCGNQGTNPADNGENTASGDTIKIGGIGPLTGAAASYGTSVKQGAQIAVDEINAAGGILGKQIEFMFEDDENNEQKSVNAYNTLMDKDMQVLIGSVTSNPCIAVADESVKDGILQITPSGSAKDCTKNDNAFRICFTDPQQGEKMAEYITGTAGLKKVAAIYDSSDAYSTGILDAFEAKLTSLGGELVAKEASARLGVPFGIIDLSLAPTPAIGDSVADILCEMGLEKAGAPGTTAALAMLNDQVKKGGLMASSYVGGLSGAFIPVSEDQGMIDAARAGALTLEKLEAMTCVCSVGLDMIAIPGDTKDTTIAGIIADEMALGMVNQKTTACRLIPVPGKSVGEEVEFGGLLGYAPIMPVNPFGCDEFVNRKGRIPAPVHSFKN